RIAIIATLRRIVSPLVIILLIASTVSIFLGELVDAGVIILMVVLSVAVDLFQSHRSQRAAERLRQIVEVQATVRRDGRWSDVSIREVVPGDLVRLSAGDI